MRESVLIFALACCSCAAVQAQQEATQSAPLRGSVVDPVGAPVKDAEIIVYREGTTVAHLRSDASGGFSFDAPSREYSVSVNAEGFAPLRTSSIPFAVGGTTKFTLSPASTSLGYPASLSSGSTAARVAQNAPSPYDVKDHASWEYGALVQGGVGTKDRSNYRFLAIGGHVGRVLTNQVGAGLLRGTFEYGVEVFPLWQSYTPRFAKISCKLLPLGGVGSDVQCSQPYTVGGTFTGVSITPIQLRWNFTHGERWMPWLQGAGGVVWTNHKYPPIGNTNPDDFASNGPSGDTSVWNFTPQFGIGTHYFVRPHRSIDFSANAVHISSASLGDKNPGVNASVQFTLGYSWWK